MKKARLAIFFSILGIALAPSCFSQNMLLLGGDYNLMGKPEVWNVGLGFNLKLYEEFVQNDFFINFGGIRARDAGNEEAASPLKFLFSVKDNLFLNKEWRWIGLRAGVFASFGFYGIRDSFKIYDMLFSTGGLAGICVLPKALISVLLDVSPGYTIAFGNDGGLRIYEAGFSLPLFLCIRINFDKW